MLAHQQKEGKHGKATHEQDNRAFAIKLTARIKENGTPVNIEALNKYVEISHIKGESYPSCINYSDHAFRDQVESALRKRKVSLGALDIHNL